MALTNLPQPWNHFYFAIKNQDNFIQCFQSKPTICPQYLIFADMVTLLCSCFTWKLAASLMLWLKKCQYLCWQKQQMLSMLVGGAARSCETRRGRGQNEREKKGGGGSCTSATLHFPWANTSCLKCGIWCFFCFSVLAGFQLCILNRGVLLASAWP